MKFCKTITFCTQHSMSSANTVPTEVAELVVRICCTQSFCDYRCQRKDVRLHATHKAILSCPIVKDSWCESSLS